MNAKWTKDHPNSTGFYWYKETPEAKPDIVIYQLRGGPEYFLPYVWRFAPANPLGGMFYNKIEGEFWSERIEPPCAEPLPPG